MANNPKSKGRVSSRDKTDAVAAARDDDAMTTIRPRRHLHPERATPEGHDATRSSSPPSAARSTSTFLKIKHDLPNAPNEFGADVASLIRRTAVAVDVSLLGGKRTSLTSQWIGRWDEIERIGSRIKWICKVEQKGCPFEVPVGPKDVAAVLGWKEAIFSTHLQNYTLFAAHKSNPALQQVIDSRGAVPKKVSQLQLLLAQIQSGNKIEVPGIIDTRGGRRRRDSDGSASEGDSSDERHRRRHGKKPRRRSVSEDSAHEYYSRSSGGRSKAKSDGRGDRARR